MRKFRFRQGGFTLIELLVVVLIIAILAAIAIPVLISQRRKGYDAQVLSALKNAARAVESHAVSTGGSYLLLNNATGASATMIAEGYRQAPNITISIRSTARNYCVRAVMSTTYLRTVDQWQQSTIRSWGTSNPRPGVPLPQATYNSCPVPPA